MLWLGVHLPQLPAEVFTRAGTVREPFVVVSGQGAQRVVAAPGPAAAKAGIAAGMTLSASSALAPGLFAFSRDEASEEAALARLAAWAGRFTPAVCLLPPNEVALEVGASLRLFGGLDNLLSLAADGLGELGYTAQTAAAPTLLGAIFLSRARPGTRVTHIDRLEPELSSLPVDALDLSPETLDTLRGLGVGCIGDCRKLPRPGLARRIGAELSRSLDRALGTRPDPRDFFVPPPGFSGRLALPAEASGAEPLLFAARRLLLELEGYLEARGAGAGGLLLTLCHREERSTRVELGLLCPARDPLRLLGLLRERLLRTKIPEPVSAVELSVEDILPFSPGNRELWKDAARDAGEAWPELVERLKSRLGGKAVRGLAAAAEHRPERAFVATEPSGVNAPDAALHFGPRPFWLLPRPVALERENVTLLCGPERIETGWWDGDEVRRDYFVAEDPQGARLWVFRERGGHGRWFLHGIFG